MFLRLVVDDEGKVAAVVRGLVPSIRSLRARLLGEVGFASPFALVTMLTTGTLATSTLAYTRAS